MSRASAIEILTAAFGQLIQIDHSWINGRKMCRLHGISNLGWENTGLTFIGEGENWYELIKETVPGALKHYDSGEDLVEQSFLDELCEQRKAKRIESKNSRSALSQDHRTDGFED
jgi:hypothetical protein